MAIPLGLPIILTGGDEILYSSSSCSDICDYPLMARMSRDIQR